MTAARDDRAAERLALKREIRMRMLTLARQLAPEKGVVRGGKYWALNPTRSDRSPNSFCVDIAGAHVGRFADFASGVKGDEIDFIAYCLSGVINEASRKDAFAYARQFLGWDRAMPNRKLIQARAAAADAEARIAAKREEEDRAARARKAFAWWNNQQALEGTHGAAYLGARGISLDALPNFPRAIRFCPEATYDGEGGRMKTPALFTAMSRAGEPRPVAVHRTFLRADKPARLPFKDAKKMWGDVTGAAMRLSKGGWKRSPEAQFKATGEMKDLILTEGMENALVAALCWPDRLVWAAGSISLIGAVVIPEFVDDLVVIGDNDLKPEARAAIERAMNKLADRYGAMRKLSLYRPTSLNDLNDLWRDEAA